MHKRRGPVALLAGVFVMLIGSLFSGGSVAAGGDLTLVAYSTPQEAYEEIIPLFTATAEGEGYSFATSFGSSGEQSRAVEGGLPADVVALSLEPDITRLVKAGLVAENWKDDPFGGMVTNSVVVFVVRKDNPKNIKTWDDLIRDDVEVLCPNPATSGGAKWNVMAAYGARIKMGETHEQALNYLRALFGNISMQDKSARESLQSFVSGKGDVLISYENEAITAQQKGEELDYVIPEQTILIQNPIAVVTESENPEAANAFVDFVRGEEAQKIFASKGYRTVVDSLADSTAYPVPAQLFKIDDLGGWEKINKEFFDPDEGIIPAIQAGE